MTVLAEWDFFTVKRPRFSGSSMELNWTTGQGRKRFEITRLIFLVDSADLRHSGGKFDLGAGAMISSLVRVALFPRLGISPRIETKRD